MSAIEKFDGLAEGYSAHDYADPSVYTARRARVAVELGPALAPGSTVLDLACGDANMAEPLLALGLRYRGVDSEPAMVEAASKLLGEVAAVEQGELDTYEPSAPVAATTVFRAIYYARDRPAFFARARSFTEKKVVFDLNPRQYRVAEIASELEAAGFRRFVVRPFLVPQTRRLPGAAVRLAIAAETTPLAQLALRRRFTYLVAALI